MQPEQVGGVARREGGEDDQAAVGEPGQWRLEVGVREQLLQRGRARLEAAPDLPLAAAQAAGLGVQRAQAQREAPGQRVLEGQAGGAGRRLAPQHIEDCSVALGQKRQGNGPAGPDHQGAALVEPGLAVPADAVGMHRDCLDHGAPAADLGAVGAERRLAAGQHRDVGRGAAHVGHHHVAGAAQGPGADQAGRGPREDGLDRPFQGRGGRDQRAVSLHHHERRLDLGLGQLVLHRQDQLLQQGDQPRVEHGGHGAARRVELAGELVTAGHRQAASLADKVAQRDLVRRVAHAEVAGHGEGGRLGRVLGDRRLGGGQVEGALLVPARLMPALEEHDRVARHGAAEA